MKRLAVLAFCFAAFTSTLAQSATPSYQGLWWNPGQSGWGMNIVHQGDILFATWFTYDKDGSGMWLVMPSAQLDPSYGMGDTYGMYGMYGGGGSSMPTYSGTVYRTTGPAFDVATFDMTKVQATAVGTAQFQFFDANDGSFTYNVGTSSGTLSITRQVFGPMPACSLGGAASGSPNFSDLWWRTGGSESGWGVNVAQEGDTIFATWFTYDGSGHGQWLVMPAGTKSGNLTWSGALYRTRGPAFDGMWDATKVVSTQVGTATFAFSDAANGTFSATVDGASITKPISRQVYASPTTVCQ
jgi:hypothetical protein